MASKITKLVGKAIRFADDVSGHSTRKLKTVADTLNRAKATNLTPERATRMAHVAETRTRHARVMTGLGTAGIAATGLMVNNAYRKHLDNKIQNQIDNYYS